MDKIEITSNFPFAIERPKVPGRIATQRGTL